MISLVVVFSMFDINAGGCFGEYHQGVAPDRVSVVCEHIETTNHRGLQIEPGTVTVKINDSLIYNCNWESVDAYHDGMNAEIQIVVSCPPQPIPLKDKR